MIHRTVLLGTTDRFLLKLESPETPAHTASLSTFKTPADAGPEFMQNLMRELFALPVSAPPFNYLLVNKHSKRWEILEPEEVDIDYHVRHSALPWPGGERELGMLISRLHARPLDFSRPLWEFHVIEGLEGGRFATYMKMHHALADGVAVVKLLSKSLTAKPGERLRAPWARTVAPTYPRKPEIAKPPDQPAKRSLFSAIAKVFKTAKKRPSRGFVGPFVAPKSVFNTRIAAARRYSTQQLELARLKAIGKAHNASVNDVFLSLVSTALRRYLIEIEALPDRPLVAAVPAATLRDVDDGLGNAVTVIYTTLGTDLDDPVGRLHVIQDSMAQGKQFISELRPRQIAIVNALSLVPAALFNLIGGGAPSRPIVNVTVSNVPGPRDTLWMGSAECQALYPCSMIVQAQALNITARGYRDKLNIGVVAARDLLPSIQRIVVYMREAMEEMEQLLGITVSANPSDQE